MKVLIQYNNKFEVMIQMENEFFDNVCHLFCHLMHAIVFYFRDICYNTLIQMSNHIKYNFDEYSSD